MFRERYHRRMLSRSTHGLTNVSVEEGLRVSTMQLDVGFDLGSDAWQDELCFSCQRINSTTALRQPTVSAVYRMCRQVRRAMRRRDRRHGFPAVANQYAICVAQWALSSRAQLEMARGHGRCEDRASWRHSASQQRNIVANIPTNAITTPNYNYVDVSGVWEINENDHVENWHRQLVCQGTTAPGRCADTEQYRAWNLRRNRSQGLGELRFPEFLI